MDRFCEEAGMKAKSLAIWVMAVVSVFSAGWAVADCPSADLTGDCFVDFEDFSVIGANWPTGYDWNDVNTLASQWLTGGVPSDPCDLVWVDINDPGVSGHEGFNGQMSKYETTNAQYCQFLNAALASGDITVDGNGVVYGANGSNGGEDFIGEVYFDTYPTRFHSQINYGGGGFSVRTRDGYDMSNHPVVMVSWYGAAAYCYYYGYRLPTEWEWQAVADYDGSYTYGCGTSIDHTKANYDWDNPLGLTSYPHTSPVDYYETNGPGPYGYGMCDMAGNVFEWTATCYYGDCDPDDRVPRGGCWSWSRGYCGVSTRVNCEPHCLYSFLGFRVCR
jgi:hypothetical protein